jgi:hypothetical protein
MVQIRRAVTDTLISVTALGALILMLAAFDDRVRDHLALSLAPGEASSQVAEASATARSLTEVVIKAVREQSIEHSPLVIFVLAATVLVLFMLRT